MPNDLKARLTKKLGPLPVWAWGALGGGAFYLWKRHKDSTSTSANTVDPNSLIAQGIDPTTGLPFGPGGTGADNSGGGVIGGTTLDTSNLEAAFQDLATSMDTLSGSVLSAAEANQGNPSVSVPADNAPAMPTSQGPSTTQPVTVPPAAPPPPQPVYTPPPVAAPTPQQIAQTVAAQVGSAVLPASQGVNNLAQLVAQAPPSQENIPSMFRNGGYPEFVAAHGGTSTAKLAQEWHNWRKAHGLE